METSKQLEPVTDKKYLHMHQPVLATVMTQLHVQIKNSLAHLQDLISALAGIKYICKVHQPKQGLNLADVLENAYL